MMLSSPLHVQQAPSIKSLPELIDRASNRFGPKIAYVCGAEKQTFAQVKADTSAIAAGLLSIPGTCFGDRVALMAPNIIEFPIITFGILRAGLVQVNVNPLYTPVELRHQLTDCDAEVIFIHEAALPTLAEIIPDTKIRHIILINNAQSYPLSMERRVWSVRNLAGAYDDPSRRERLLFEYRKTTTRHFDQTA